MVEITAKPKLSIRFEQALVYATQIHAKQIRKCSNIPYISHLLSVTALVLEDGGDEDEAIAALLHDAVEDMGGKEIRTAILEKFGEKVINIIDSCTESYTYPKPPWRERKLQYIKQIRLGSPSVLRVSMADKLHNARSILTDWYREGDIIWQKLNGGKEGTLWFYHQLLEVYQQHTSNFLSQELERIITQLENLENF